MNRKFNILLVDDEDSQRLTLKGFLSKKNYQVSDFNNVDDALKAFKNNFFDIIITDYKMPEKSGKELIIEAKKINPFIPVIVVTAFGEIEDAVDFMKQGATDFIQKPIELNDLMTLISKIEKNSLIKDENNEIVEKVQKDLKKVSINSIVYQSAEMENVINIASRVAPSKASVLIRGESGTGKELISRAIHSGSNRRNMPFVVVNCAALPETLFESELFGHEKGAFTGAVKTRIGKFEQAHNGTLFIDEVGDIPLPVQVKLLRALQFGEIERLGSERTIKVDVRIISATNRNLEEMIADKLFREDLLYRLNVVSIDIPPLRMRKMDLKPLIDSFISKYSEINGKKINGIDKSALDFLIKYDYPGNIRELENIIQRAVVLARDKYILSDDLPSEIQYQHEKAETNKENCFGAGDLNANVEKLEKEMIKSALIQTQGNQVKAAELLNISERTLRYKMGKYDLK